MDLGQATRPREAPQEFTDNTPRRKCTFCCGVRCAAVTGAVILAISLPCNLAMLGGKFFDGRGILGFMDRHLFLALPVAMITFTHQFLLSEFLWSKNKKTVWQINMESAGLNVAFWTVLTGASTFLSRKYLVQKSRTYRLIVWEYQRTRRSCANKYYPTAFGKISEDLDWYNIMWTLSVYHILWGAASVALEKQLGAHYAMFYRDWKYSKWCSPRWREWRETEIHRLVDTEHKVSPSRWGSFVTNDRWRSSRV